MTIANKATFKLHFEERGRGLPLLLIHGFPFSGRMWAGQLESLSKSARVLAPDLPGFGDSPARQGAASVDQYAEDCLSVLDALHIMDPVVIGGLSMGGYIALAAARLFPLRVSGLILASTRAGADTAESKTTRDKTIAQVKESGASVVAESMYPKLLSSDTYKDQPAVANELKAIMRTATSEGVIAALAAMRDRLDSTDLLPNLHMPVLIIHGKDDRVIPPAEAEGMAKAIPNNALHLIDKAGHLPNLEQPEEFNRSVTKFLGKLV
ncbi:MAG: alpha/beta hydrolase [Chloroflexi bacterium]|nr:alpha/beta hydrolase [Chloroflexota bacterium]